MGRVFTPASESQQALPVKEKKQSKEFSSCPQKSFQTKVANDNDWDKSASESYEQEDDFMQRDETSMCIETLVDEVQAHDDNGSCQDEVSHPEKYVFINSELLKKELEVEVEVHPSIFQEDIEAKSLLSKIARGSCSRECEKDGLCAGLENPIRHSTAEL